MGESLSQAVDQVVQNLVLYLPKVFAALAFALIGWLLARLARAVCVRLVRSLEKVTARFSGADTTKLRADSGRIAGNIVFWVVLLFFVTAALQVLGVDAFSVWVDRMLVYLPRLVTGALIVLGGYILGGIARELVTVGASAFGETQSAVLGSTAQVAVFATAVVIGAGQMGIEVEFLIIIGSIIVGAVFGGIALAVSLGAATFVSNLIGAHQLKKSHRVGQRVILAGHEGKIIELTSTSLVLDSSEGRVTLPAKLFSEQPTVVQAGADADE